MTECAPGIRGLAPSCSSWEKVEELTDVRDLLWAWHSPSHIVSSLILRKWLTSISLSSFQRGIVHHSKTSFSCSSALTSCSNLENWGFLMFPKFNYLLCSQVLTETCSLNTGLSVLFSSHDLYIHCFPYICPCPQPRNQSRLLARRYPRICPNACHSVCLFQGALVVKNHLPMQET